MIDRAAKKEMDIFGEGRALASVDLDDWLFLCRRSNCVVEGDSTDLTCTFHDLKRPIRTRKQNEFHIRTFFSFCNNNSKGADLDNVRSQCGILLQAELCIASTKTLRHPSSHASL